MNKGCWRYIEENEVSAYYGLASDEILMNSHNQENAFPVSLKLYTYKSYSALCGRFQNLSAEINVEACKANGFDVSRRLTGGGAIIMGADQLGICLTTNTSQYQWNHIRDLYQLFSEPLIRSLEKFNIKASLRAKNDLEVNGKKIAGLGIYVSPEGGVQFHSSLLLDLDVPSMLKVLNIPIQKYSDKRMIQSVGQRMTTVRQESGSSISMTELKRVIRLAYESFFNASLTLEPFSDQEKIQIEKLEIDRYRSEEWLFQHSPQDDMTGMSLKKTAAGLLRTYIGLKGDTIKSVLITGDFLEMPEAFAHIERQLKWSVLDREKIEQIVNKTVLDYPISDISVFEITDAIWIAAQRAHAAHRYTYRGSCYYPKEAAHA